MPLAYGGGVRTVEQARQIYALGVEKICLQTSVLENLNLVTEMAQQFGSQSIMVSVDIKRNWMGKPHIYSSAKDSSVGSDWVERTKKLVSAGAGEVLLNAVDKDGTLQGPDLSLISQLSKEIDVPLIALGGVGSLHDIKSALDAGANAVAAGSFFIYHGPHRAVLLSYPSKADFVKYKIFIENE